MTDPKRLLEEVGGVQRELLRAGKEEAPPSDAKGRAAVALGVVTGTAVTTSATTAGATAVATKAAWLGMSLGTVKVVGVCMASTAIAAVAIHAAVHRDSPKAVPVAAGPAVSSVTPALPRVPVATPPPPAPPSAAAPMETATSAPTQPTSIPGAHPALPAVSGSSAPTRASPMSDQLALLDLARAAYQSGDPGRTLRLLDEYDELYPRSSFALESEVLRIDALAAAGRTSEALAAADRFLEAHPNEPMSRRVRSIAERLRGGSNP